MNLLFLLTVANSINVPTTTGLNTAQAKHVQSQSSIPSYEELLQANKGIIRAGDTFKTPTKRLNKRLSILIPEGNKTSNFHVGFTFSNKTVKLETFRDIALRTFNLVGRDIPADPCCKNSGGCKRFRDGFSSNSCNPSAAGCCTTITDSSKNVKCVDYGKGILHRILSVDSLKDSCQSANECKANLSLKVLNQHAISTKNNEVAIKYQINSSYNDKDPQKSIQIRNELIEKLSKSSQDYLENTGKCSVTEQNARLTQGKKRFIPQEDEQVSQDFQKIHRFEEASASNGIWVSRDNDDGSTTVIYHFWVDFSPITPSTKSNSNGFVCEALSKTFSKPLFDKSVLIGFCGDKRLI